MAFRNLTNVGKEYLATRLANQLPVKFTKAKIGNGSVPLATDPAQTTDLYGFKKQVTILKTIQEQNSIKLTVQITNDEINEGFYLKEIGIFVDNNGEEVLYWYCNEDNSQYINAQTDTPLSFEVDIVMEVTNINSTVVEWNGKDTWINKEFLKEELDKKLDKGAVSTEYDTAKKIEDKIENLIKTKEPNITKNTAFNKDFGTSEDEVLEGAKLAETLGIPYGGILNNSNTKTEGTAYYDSTTKKTYKCTVTNTLNYADASKYEAISNNDLLAKFQNLWNVDVLYQASNLNDPSGQTVSLANPINKYRIIVIEGIDSDAKDINQNFYITNFIKISSSTDQKGCYCIGDTNGDYVRFKFKTYSSIYFVLTDNFRINKIYGIL